jgi:hypothetical protein
LLGWLRKKKKGRRCPACGHRLGNEVGPQCPLCGFAIGDTRVTGADNTPYATSFSEGARGWRRMCAWVWTAPAQRLKHLALIRASAASQRFARVNVALMAMALAVFALTRIGWHEVAASPTLEPGGLLPDTDGWFHVASYPEPRPLDLPAQTPVDLWWSGPQATLGIVAGVVLGMAALWITLLLIRLGTTWAHRPPYRAEQRMTASLHYLTAWVVPIVMGTLVLALLPITYIGRVSRWPWYPPETPLLWIAAVLAGSGVCLWWYWLVRLASTAPQRTRARVVAFAAVGAPLVVAGGVTAWYFGLHAVVEHFAQAWLLEF